MADHIKRDEPYEPGTAKGTTGGGDTGAEDLRRDPEDRTEHGGGTVGDQVRFDPNGDPRNPNPTGDDPFTATTEGLEPMSKREADVEKFQNQDPTGEQGPTYEQNQGDASANPSGSIDPHNNLGHEDSGLER